jgi:hypothetical protein
MKIQILTHVAAVIVGFVGGLWYHKYLKTQEAVVAKAPDELTRRVPVQTSSKYTDANLVNSAVGMSNYEFAERLTFVYAAATTPERQVTKDGLIATCNGPQALAFYEYYKKVNGMNLDGDGKELRAFLTTVGQRLGSEISETFRVRFPKGTWDMDSLVHGWAKGQPAAAIAWVQGLPQDSPMRLRLLQGVLWGVAETNPAEAIKLFHELPEKDKNSKEAVYGVGNSLVRSFGLDALNSVPHRH